MRVFTLTDNKVLKIFGLICSLSVGTNKHISPLKNSGGLKISIYTLLIRDNVIVMTLFYLQN